MGAAIAPQVVTGAFTVGGALLAFGGALWVRYLDRRQAKADRLRAERLAAASDFIGSVHEFSSLRELARIQTEKTLPSWLVEGAMRATGNMMANEGRVSLLFTAEVGEAARAVIRAAEPSVRTGEQAQEGNLRQTMEKFRTLVKSYLEDAS